MLYKKELVYIGYKFTRIPRYKYKVCSCYCKFGKNESGYDCFTERLSNLKGNPTLNTVCRYIKSKIIGYNTSNFLYAIKA